MQNRRECGCRSGRVACGQRAGAFRPVVCCAAAV